MGQSRIFHESCLTSNVRVLTVDIFDTLLPRRAICERRRHMMAARIIASDPRLAGCHPDAIFSARRTAQDMAYRELQNAARSGDVRLETILRAQLALLSLSDDLLPLLQAAEIDVEIQAVRANTDFVAQIERCRHAGVRVVGLSDTAMSRVELLSVIDARCGAHVLDDLYTSADLQATKRAGDAFDAVARAEGVAPSEIFHVGDDETADLRSAQARGVNALHIPRSARHEAGRRADALRFEIGRRFSRVSPRRPIEPRAELRALSPGELFGPIVAEFCMRLWLYLSGIPDRDKAVVLFCARGGLSMRLVFERFASRVGLSVPVRCVNFMVSRLVAVRGPLLRGDVAACEELAREFADSTLAETARALTGSEFSFEPAWDNPFDAQEFLRLMDTTPTGADVRRILSEQAELFTEYLANCTAGATRVILCDTGLYGSTMRLLQSAYPEYEWECVLFARRNYKGFPSPHFARTAGLSVQSDNYDPFRPRTSILRYWQLIESLFEPNIPTCKIFQRATDGSAVSTVETADWVASPEVFCRPAFLSTLQYLQSLDRRRWFSQITSDCDVAWTALRSAIVFPKASSIEALSIRRPTRDLGRSASDDPNIRQTRGISGLRSAYWREGYLAEQFPRSGRLLQLGLEAFFAAKYVAAEVARRFPSGSFTLKRRQRSKGLTGVAAANQEST